MYEKYYLTNLARAIFVFNEMFSMYGWHKNREKRIEYTALILKIKFVFLFYLSIFCYGNTTGPPPIVGKLKSSFKTSYPENFLSCLSLFRLVSSKFPHFSEHFHSEHCFLINLPVSFQTFFLKPLYQTEAS